MNFFLAFILLVLRPSECAFRDWAAVDTTGSSNIPPQRFGGAMTIIPNSTSFLAIGGVKKTNEKKFKKMKLKFKKKYIYIYIRCPPRKPTLVCGSLAGVGNGYFVIFPLVPLAFLFPQDPFRPSSPPKTSGLSLTLTQTERRGATRSTPIDGIPTRTPSFCWRNLRPLLFRGTSPSLEEDDHQRSSQRKDAYLT
jgi:hypothetical protein